MYTIAVFTDGVRGSIRIARKKEQRNEICPTSGRLRGAVPPVCVWKLAHDAEQRGYKRNLEWVGCDHEWD